jgi:hypothetical protein
MRAVLARSRGLRRLGDGIPSDAAGPLDEPVVEEITIPPGHGSGEYDITTINGVLLTQFSFILMTMRGVTQDGVGDELGLRFSSDGGSTWLSGATSYRSSDVNASGAAVSSADYAAISSAVSFADVSVWITDMNVPIPTGLIANEMVAGAAFTSRRASMTWENAEVHDGIQLYIPDITVFTGGIIDLAGWR